MQSDAPDSMIDHIVIVKARLQNIKLSKIIQEAHLFQEEMIKAGRKPATVNRRMAVVRRVLNLCYKKWDWIHEPLGQKISMLKENNQRHVYLTADEIENLAVLSPREDVGNFIRLAAYTGLRRGELLGLMPHNFIKGRIVLEANTKNRKPRVVPVPKHLHKYLKDLPIKLEKHHIKWHFDVARKAYGHPEWRLHDLRHTYGSFLAANPEIPVTVIRDLMGHSSLSVSSRYLHLRTKSLDDAVSKIPVPNKKSAKLSTKRSQNKKTKKKDDE
ncbi:MAG: hypothetical protein K0R66_1736 [Gammaproteobacteria bacterium]|jgi:integrase|nr:hypothetical protein [Gammaproteobacteria bacterium]